MTEDRISEIGNRSIEFTQTEQQRDIVLKKWRVSVACETIKQELAFVSSESQKERRERGTGKYSKK